LLAQHCGALLEVLAVLFGPPASQRAAAVIFRALIVEAVADLVADHRADAAIVHRIVGIGIEEGRLQDRGREEDRIERGV
jgi:hypothetical protein